MSEVCPQFGPSVHRESKKSTAEWVLVNRGSSYHRLMDPQACHVTISHNSKGGPSRAQLKGTHNIFMVINSERQKFRFKTLSFWQFVLLLALFDIREAWISLIWSSQAQRPLPPVVDCEGQPIRSKLQLNQLISD